MASLLICAIAAPRTAGKNARAASLETADQVIDAYIDARGGRDKLAAIKTLRVAGPLDLGNGSTATLIVEQKRPNLIRMDFVFQGQTNVCAFDGKVGWYHIPFMDIPNPTVMPPEELKNIVEDADIDGPLVDYKNKGNSVELAGHEQLDGRDCYKLKLTLKDKAEGNRYIDAETLREVRVEGAEVENGQEVQFIQTFSDFREVAGVTFPFVSRVEQKGAAELATFTHKIDKIEVNVPMDDAHFAMPATQPTTKP